MAKMSVNRKLQTEIDRTLKKVDEGVALFDEIWDKVYSATQQNQKEKYEGDLKKEIKKLQRHRDSVKGWLQSNDIKDKTVLLEVRRRIESKMEQFKVCEKETKTKKFSKEGLAREAEMDPEEKEKMEKRDWLTERIQMLNTQLEGFEADVEKAMATVGKKKKAADSERIGVLENARKQHNYHIGRLEQMLRLLDNNDLAPEQVEIISEDLDWYISQAGDDIHLIEKFECEDAYDLYEPLSLDELAAPGAPPVVKGTKKLEMLAEGDEEDGEGEGAGGDEAPMTTTKLRGKKSKAVVAVATAGGLPLTIGRPVVKTVKEAAKIATPTAGVRTKTIAGMPIIGRPVMSPAGPTLPAAPPSKVTKGPGMGDSPQAINHHQQHHQQPQQQAAPGTQGQAMISGGRMGAAGQQTPGQPMQPSGASTPIKMVRSAPTDNLQTPQRQSGMAPALARTPPSGNAQLNSNANNSQTPSRQGGSQLHQHQSQQGHVPMSSFNTVAGPSSNMSNANPNSNQTGLTQQQQHHLQHQNQQHEQQQQQQQQPGTQQKQHQSQQPQHQQQHQYQQQQHQQPPQQHQQPPQQHQQQQQQQQQHLQMQQQQQQAAQHHPQQQQKQQQQQHHQQQQRMGQAALKGNPMDSSAGVGAASEDDQSGVPIGMAQGQHHNQHHNALGTATAATARQSAEASGRAALEHSMMFRPQAEDSERSKPYVPRNPYRTPAAFPSQPAAAFEKPQMFEKLNTDTLFLIFYYQQGTYQQYLAARELKRQSWRYHKKYMTWFQRHEEPKITTDEYEQGTYVYFDYETGWCQRIKSDFRFDYVFLEDEAL